MSSENINASNETLFFCFLDSQKAFDTVWRNKLFVKLLNKKINPHLLKLIIACYSASSTCIKTNNLIAPPFQTSLGVLQGSILSPNLYAFFVNELITKVQNINTSLPTNIRVFADDIVLFALTVKTLIKLIKICIDFSISHHFIFNLIKSLLFLFNSRNTLGIKRTVIQMQQFTEALKKCQSKKYSKFSTPPSITMKR